MSKGRLSELQKQVLREFFAREQGFFLTGGAALAGYHLGHRTTQDLDLFTLDDRAFERGLPVLRDLAASLGASLEIIQDAPGFRRALLSADGEGLVVDLVRERVSQVHETKLEEDGVRMDSPDEILANKLAALVGRSEERDLVDTYFLLDSGLPLEAALAQANAKDGGCTPAALAWVLSQVEIPDAVTLPAGVAPETLRSFLADLIRTLRRLAHPGPPDA